MSTREKELRKKFENANQEQVFKFFDVLSKTEKENFLTQLESFDVENLNKNFKSSISHYNDLKSGKIKKEKITPPGKIATNNLSEEASKNLLKEGLSIISKGKVGILLLAGGQGTRLGSSDPKGMYDIGLPSKSSLFQMQAERVRKINELSHRGNNEKKFTIFWYIMTSSFTYAPTVKYFAENNNFGIDKNNIIIFSQDNLPCLTKTGKIILESKTKIAFAPNGNGGMYLALKNHGILKHMKENGIEYVQTYGVDNSLCKVLDPVFVAHCVGKKVDFGAKVLSKRTWNEKVGIFGLKNGKLDVVEYSEISEKMAKQIDSETKQLAFNHANIVIFFFSLSFLNDCAEFMKSTREYHVAIKKIPYANEKGETVKPQETNGVKLELFNFDICKNSKISTLLTVKRSEEFSPLKNAPNKGNKDSPETCREHLSNLNKKRLNQVGAVLKGEGICEISPLLSYEIEGLEKFKGKTITLPCTLRI